MANKKKHRWTKSTPAYKPTETRSETLQRLGIDELTDNFNRKSFRTANKTAHLAPEILFEYFDRDKVRMYECKPANEGEPNRQFNADTYDRNFKPAHGKKMIAARH